VVRERSRPRLRGPPGPGERGPFHVHDETYFWTVVEPGRGLQRAVDGTYVVRNYTEGQTRYLTPTAADPLVHDLENVGTTTLRFVTVALKHDRTGAATP
jgi:hypothetical protein